MSAFIFIVSFLAFAIVFAILRAFEFTWGAWIGIIPVVLILFVAFDFWPILLIAGIIKLLKRK